MRRLKQSGIASFAICGLLGAVAGIVYAASSAIVVKDIAGKSLTFFSETNARSKTVVFIFVLPDCPICNSYVPDLKRIRRASVTLPAEVDVVGLYPHMHRLGKEVKVTARFPDGTEKILLWINDWNFNWQMYYQNVKPVRLPPNTELVMECIHDNSAERDKTA